MNLFRVWPNTHPDSVRFLQAFLVRGVLLVVLGQGAGGLQGTGKALSISVPVGTSVQHHKCHCCSYSEHPEHARRACARYKTRLCGGLACCCSFLGYTLSETLLQGCCSPKCKVALEKIPRPCFASLISSVCTRTPRLAKYL